MRGGQAYSAKLDVLGSKKQVRYIRIPPCSAKSTKGTYPKRRLGKLLMGRVCIFRASATLLGQFRCTFSAIE